MLHSSIAVHRHPEPVRYGTLTSVFAHLAGEALKARAARRCAERVIGPSRVSQTYYHRRSVDACLPGVVEVDDAPEPVRRSA
jgi:hypothetical protein